MPCAHICHCFVFDILNPLFSVHPYQYQGKITLAIKNDQNKQKQKMKAVNFFLLCSAPQKYVYTKYQRKSSSKILPHRFHINKVISRATYFCPLLLCLLIWVPIIALNWILLAYNTHNDNPFILFTFLYCRDLNCDMLTSNVIRKKEQ